MEKSEEKPKFYAGLGMKVNIGNFENQDISFGFSGIPADATQEYLQELITTGIPKVQFVMQAMGQELLRQLKENYGR